MDESTLRKVLTEVIDQRNAVDDQTHRLHHDFVTRLIEREKLRQERWEKWRTHVMGWATVAAITGAVYLLGAGVQQWLKQLFNRP